MAASSSNPVDSAALIMSPAKSGSAKSAHTFRTSPLVDLNNKLLVASPQSELSSKLQHTSLCSSVNEDELGEGHGTKHLVVTRTSSTSSGHLFIHGEPQPTNEGDLTSTGQVGPNDPPDHFLTLIKNIPNNMAIKNLHRRSSLQSGLQTTAIKRTAVSEATSQSHKKIRGLVGSGLESIEECTSSPSLESRIRAVSAPTPFGNQTKVVKPTFIDDIALTPTKPPQETENDENRQESTVTPMVAKNRPAARKTLAISKSLIEFDAVGAKMDPLTDITFEQTQKQSFISPQKLSTREIRCDQQLTGDMSKKCLLPCRLCDGVPVVDCDEVAKLLEGKYAAEIERAYIVDCRFPYEFRGGHIRGAVNFPHPFFGNLKMAFFKSKNCMEVQNKNAAWVRSQVDSTDRVEFTGHRIIVIFHCEFSSYRAPHTFRWFRTEDRNAYTIANYPKLDYPEAYVLYGGYKAFVNYCRKVGKQHLCEPAGAYVKQGDSRYSEDLRKFQHRIKTMSDVDGRLVLGSNDTFEDTTGSDSEAKVGFSLGSPVLTRNHDDEDETGFSNSFSNPSSAVRLDDEFDDDDLNLKVKMCHYKREVLRRRSDCPRPSSGGLFTVFGRASFEELHSPLK